MTKKIEQHDIACANCLFGVPDAESGQVICHFLPPTPTLMRVPNPVAIQTPGAPSHEVVNQALPPMLNPSWWCSQGVNKNTSTPFYRPPS